MSRKFLNSRPFLRAFSVFAVMFFALHFTAWLWSVNRLVVLIDYQADRLRSQGWRVELASARYGGWPGQARVEVGPMTVAADGLSVRVETLIAEAALVRPGPLTWRSRGHAIRFGSGLERPVLAADVAGEALPDGIVLTTAATRVAELFEAEALQARIGPNDLTVMVQRLRPIAAGWALGPSIEDLELHVEVVSPTSLAADSQFSASPSKSEQDHFNIRSTHLTAAGMDVTGRAELWFDAALRPRLDGIIHIAGYAAGLDGLAATNIISPRAAVAAKAVLNLFAMPPDGGAEIPVRIEDGILYAAQFALIRLPTLDEPGSVSLR